MPINYSPPFKYPELGDAYRSLKDLIHQWVDAYTVNNFEKPKIRRMLGTLDSATRIILDPKFKFMVNNSESAKTLVTRQKISNFVMDCNTLIIINKLKVKSGSSEMLNNINWLMHLLMKINERTL